MKKFIFSLPVNILRCFTGKMAMAQLAAFLLTLILVKSGFDWRYFQATDTPAIRAWLFPAAVIGFFVPIFLPLLLLLAGGFSRMRGCWLAGCAIAQAEIIGSLISSSYKALTGRAHPVHNGTADISEVFRLGLMRGGMFWGWPSSHTTIAFAMAVTLLRLAPGNRWVGPIAMAYALYIGIGVSATIHWFSDFVAGAIIGTVIGLVVGASFRPSERRLP